MEKATEFPEHRPTAAHLTKKKQPIPGSGGDMPQTDQEALVARLRAGDRAAAAQLVEMYYEQIYLFMRRLGHDQQVSEDLTQESFLNAWYHIGQLRNGRALNSWLYRIAVNVSRLYWRKHRGKEEKQITFDLREDAPSELEKAGEREQLQQLQNAVSALPFKLRQAVILHYMQHLTIAEAAEAAGIREGTFKSRLNRALRILRKTLRQNSGGPGYENG